SITNVVATYPSNPLCLGLYEPWKQNWYTDQSIRCIYPELGRLVGYAVTVVYSLPDPRFNRLSMKDLVAALAKSKKPTIIVAKQDFPPEILPKVGLSGGNMTTMFKTCGAVGFVTNGPSRDIDEIRPMKFQYFISGITPGHGDFAVSAVNVPVSVAGMDVAPGEIIHMDENGACKFPADRLADVYNNVKELAKREKESMKKVSSLKNAEDVLNMLESR
ncbi:MAG: RraA family protein, partial [Dehalococcoidales bacterium]|nr:RraA family protein [Dehalococcoidales bacterium]